MDALAWEVMEDKAVESCGIQSREEWRNGKRASWRKKFLTTETRRTLIVNGRTIFHGCTMTKVYEDGTTDPAYPMQSGFAEIISVEPAERSGFALIVYLSGHGEKREMEVRVSEEEGEMTPASELVSADVTEAMDYLSSAPWKVVKSRTGMAINDGNGRCVIEQIGWIDNARLIASAPELLKAAVELLARLDHITTEDFGRGGEKAEREALRAAIAKALGLAVEAV